MERNVFTPVCQSYCSQGEGGMRGRGMHGGRCAWQGACMAGGMCGGGCPQKGTVPVAIGACMA